MKLFLRKLLAGLLATAFIASALLIAVCSGHECAKTNCACPERDCIHSCCELCTVISLCERLMTGVAALAVLRAFCRLPAIVAFSEIGRICICRRKTPVQLRTMLLC